VVLFSSRLKALLQPNEFAGYFVGAPLGANKSRTWFLYADQLTAN